MRSGGWDPATASRPRRFALRQRLRADLADLAFEGVGLGARPSNIRMLFHRQPSRFLESERRLFLGMDEASPQTQHGTQQIIDSHTILLF